MASQVDAVEREFLLCARYGELEEMLEELAKGADVMARGDGGNTALHMACANGHEAIVAALLDRGAEPSATNDCGNTPAHYAAQQRHAPCLKLIFGRSALTDAIASGDGAVATIALEHDSATEEKIIAGLAATGLDHVTHSLNFAARRGARRELQISKAVDETLGDGGGASDRTGLGIWAASLALGRWLAEKGDAFDPRRVVELGRWLRRRRPRARRGLPDRARRRDGLLCGDARERGAQRRALFREDRPANKRSSPGSGPRRASPPRSSTGTPSPGDL
ncbi:hypothetical protein SO694_00176036 [Aureococcus anophagefferens]|uniref:Ankyrin repeat protein n=1 Tax=Aureococcus anophagefferens TaxID=44056 RepID=A0ABR1FGP8_AURAN